MILPAMGIISEIIPVFARKPIFGYKAVALSTVAIGFYSMLVWAHHMFTVGPNYLNGFFMLSSMIIAIPTGVKIFNWLATLWRGNLSLETPLLYALGFLSIFTVGGLSSIYLAAFTVDWQVHDTYFVVAHFHYVLFGGSVFAIIGGLWYCGRRCSAGCSRSGWASGRSSSSSSGSTSFFPQHMLGLMGMPRRIYTYENTDWEGYNLTSTIGSYVMAAASRIVVAVWRGRKGRRAGNDPWLADTLEWYTTSPPPPHSFDTVPYVTSARSTTLRRLKEQGAL